MKSKQKGFTLIELLVVIAIIALLSSVVLASLSTARAKSRDSKRIASVRQLMLALEMYNNQTGHYPYSPGCGASFPNSGWCNSSQSLENGRWIRDNGVKGVLSEYIKEEPIDPIPKAPINVGSPRDPGVIYYFAFTPTSTQYLGMYGIVFSLENYPHILEKSSGITDCLGNIMNYGNGSNGIITLGMSCQK